MSIQRWHIDKCEDSVYPVKTQAGNWMKTVDVLAALAAKEREIERLKAQVERLKAPVSDEEWLNFWLPIARINVDRTSMTRKEVSNLIAARAAEKGPRNER